MSKLFTLSEAASIAIHGIVLIARSNKMTNVLEIAQITGSSRHHVAKIMQRLVKENYLNSHRGSLGGFSLRKKPEEISFLDLYEAIEGKIEIDDCPMGKDACPFGGCLIDNITKDMTLKFRDYLKNRTVDKCL